MTVAKRWTGSAWEVVGPSGAVVGADKIVVSPSNPGFTIPGLWIQTGLGTDGTDFTFWIEDGT